MSNEILLNKIINKIEFKIQPNQNIRKSYIIELKKNFIN